MHNNIYWKTAYAYTELSENPPPDFAAKAAPALRIRLCSVVVLRIRMAVGQGRGVTGTAGEG